MEKSMAMEMEARIEGLGFRCGAYKEFRSFGL